ncbi:MULTISPECIES: hypothetical protein [unclassified Flavobacterium]|uniref:hypothetical protein n=1 Tax=unclassified Flavobacterium TaxID=196869 RepID=UPI0012A9A471|nr:MULTISPECIES: hypothetical protein [unclassified Flavobacterium]MBF4483458.1 hypothetical protein [Flavobacterium sp. CSZ]QGK74275.1 hypothetical protein GIY83_09475 [Flavobacterium sp. SLB02]
MKKIKLIITAISLTSVIFSCSNSENDKNEIVCYKCTQNIETKYNGLIAGSSSLEADFCNNTPVEIEKLQQDSTYVKTNGEITETSTFKCKLKK